LLKLKLTNFCHLLTHSSPGYITPYPISYITPYYSILTMAPKRDPRKPPVPAPAPPGFLGAKKKSISAAAAAKSAGGPQPRPPGKTPASATVTSASAAASSSSSSASSSETRGDKRQRNSSGPAELEAKKQREAGFDPQASAVPLGAARQPPPSPATSISTVHSEATDGGHVVDQEVGDELEQIKHCITQMDVGALPYAGQVCKHANTL